ncbi:MAG: hypothetical protein ACFFCD_09765 [Promethearchaeota archaeon]
MRTRKELAEVLRKRQFDKAPTLAAQLGLDVNLFKQYVAAISDEDIIISYIKCSQCGEMMATLEDIDTVLEQNPKDYDEFWDIFDDLFPPKHAHG